VLTTVKAPGGFADRDETVARDLLRESAVADGRLDGRSQAQIVRVAAVREVDVGAPLGVLVVVDQTRGLEATAVHVVLRDLFGDPLGNFVVARSRVVAKGDRDEHSGNGGGGRHGVRDLERVQIRAEQIELLLGKGKRSSRGDVGGGDLDEGGHPLLEIGEGGAVEQLRVVVVRDDVRSVVGVEAASGPVAGQEDAANELALDVVLQEPGLEGGGEDRISVQGVVGGDDAATRNAEDQVDLVQEAPAAWEDRVPELLEGTECEARGARPAAREREHDQHPAGVVAWRKAVAAFRVPVLERFVPRNLRRAGDGEHGAADESEEPGRHAATVVPRAGPLKQVRGTGIPCPLPSEAGV
jgi:hypothetical protein